MGHYSMGGWRGKFSQKVDVKNLVDHNNFEKNIGNNGVLVNINNPPGLLLLGLTKKYFQWSKIHLFFLIV